MDNNGHTLVCKDNKVNYTAITTFNNGVNYLTKHIKMLQSIHTLPVVQQV